MPSPSVSGFFGKGGNKTAKLEKIGDSVEGEIVSVSDPVPQTDFETRVPIEGKYQVIIVLATDQRDPEVADDNGHRAIYCKGWLAGAVGDALREKGVAEPAVGGWMKVIYSSTAAPTRPGLKGAKQFTVEYSPTGAVFGNGDTPPPGIDPTSWKSMSAEAKAAVLATANK